MEIAYLLRSCLPHRAPYRNHHRANVFKVAMGVAARRAGSAGQILPDPSALNKPHVAQPHEWNTVAVQPLAERGILLFDGCDSRIPGDAQPPLRRAPDEFRGLRRLALECGRVQTAVHRRQSPGAGIHGQREHGVSPGDVPPTHHVRLVAVQQVHGDGQ